MAAHQEALKKEIERLRKVYKEQKMGNNKPTTESPHNFNNMMTTNLDEE